MDRIVCAFIPRYELALRLRADASLKGKPVAVADLSVGTPRIAALSSEAERLGVRFGQRVSQARALCPELLFVAPDGPAHQAAEREILSALSLLSPLLDSDGHGAFFLSLQGLSRLVPDEKVFANQVRSTVQKAGFDAGVAVASHAFVAWVAAARRDISIVDHGAEDRWLELVPAASLGLSEPGQKLLDLLGVHSARQVAALPKGSLARRLGDEGVRLERLCRQEGLWAAPSQAHVPLHPEEVELDLDLPLEDLETLLFLFKSLVDRLLLALQRERQALVQLTVVTRLDDRTDLTHTLTPAEPTLDSKILMDLLRLWLGSTPFQSAVQRIKLIASKSGTATARQLDLFRQKEQLGQEALSRAIARLTSAFGEKAVVRPVLEETFRPEARIRWEDRHAPRTQQKTADPVQLPRVLKLLPAPEPVEWKHPWLKRAGRNHRVLRSEGPHRLAGEWWTAQPFDRSYHWVWLSDGALIWIFQDGLSGGYFVQAVAD